MTRLLIIRVLEWWWLLEIIHV